MARGSWMLVALAGLVCAMPAAASDGSIEVRAQGGWASTASHSDDGDIYDGGTLWCVGVGWAASRRELTVRATDRSGPFTFDSPLHGSNTTLWLTLGAGVDIRLARAASMFVEARLHNASSAAPLAVPVAPRSTIETANQQSVTVGIVLRP